VFTVVGYIKLDYLSRKYTVQVSDFPQSESRKEIILSVENLHFLRKNDNSVFKNLCSYSINVCWGGET